MIGSSGLFTAVEGLKNRVGRSGGAAPAPRTRRRPGPIAITLLGAVGVRSLTDPSGIAGGGSSADVTLPYAVAHAVNGDSISFAGSLGGDTITLNSTLTLSHNVTITGLGAASLAVSGNNAHQVFDIASGVTAGILGLTIKSGSAANGGGIKNNGTLTLTNDAISNNGAISNTSILNGAGIYNTGTLNISYSTINNNTAYSNGGGIYNSGTLSMSNSTVQCARAIGARVIAVATGLHTVDELAPTKPDLLLADLSNLASVQAAWKAVA